MKSLVDFLKENKQYKYPTDLYRSFESFKENNKFDDYIPENAIDWYVNEVWDNEHSNYFIGHTNNPVSLFDYITEMSHSMTCKQLIKALNRDFASEYGEIFCSKKNVDKRVTCSLIIPAEIFKNDWQKFQQRLEAYMWYETRHLNKTGVNNNPAPPKIEQTYGKEFITIIVDPVQAKECNDYVYNKCNGIIYHVPDQKRINDIMKSGLRMKGSKNRYKFIMDRVYFICGESKSEINKRLLRIFNDKSVYDENPVIFKIDLKKNNYNINFYEDPAYKNLDAIYTYAYFPSKYIEKINYKDL